ncbi:putative transmembrane methyl-accepting chemotaxis protein [Oxalobacteraceae bacterium IMCC9480]|nr:putative transmembrane methyl-accepting chemotaxis protein [Oxalobacteraceae bacterium IMCC9480]
MVAAEVRSLAQRSATAAKEIKGLISDSVDKVDAGARLVDQAGVTMDEIVTSVQRVTDIMGEISSASAEQTRGIEQINMAITEMDDVTQQNAALVEQAAAAAQSMQDQARHLSGVVSIFRLDGTGVALPVAAKTGTVAAVRIPVARKTLIARATGSSSLAVKKPAAGNDDWEEF